MKIRKDFKACDVGGRASAGERHSYTTIPGGVNIEIPKKLGLGPDAVSGSVSRLNSTSVPVHPQ
jgi:hypothetical protein